MYLECHGLVPDPALHQHLALVATCRLRRGCNRILTILEEAFSIREADVSRGRAGWHYDDGPGRA